MRSRAATTATSRRIAESQTELLARHLGAEIIAEEDHGA